MKIERTRNAIRNTKWGIIQKIVHIVMPFLVRTVLIYVLSAEYSGLNSLFTSILHILSLTELGFSNAIVFSMYKPIAEDDKDTICALLNIYRKAYQVIGTTILVLGTALVPFLPYLINGNVPPDINLYVLYYIYLINTVLSYFLFAYKTCLLSAHQREDLLSKNTLVYNSICYFLQCLSLLLFRNYYIYVFILPLSTIILNLMNAHTVNKYFPEYKPKGTISVEEKKELKKNIVGLMIWKIGGATRNTLDSIVVSAYIGLVAVAMYNNYFHIISGVIAILGVICTSMAAGVGNKIATDTPENNYKDFQRFHFYYMWIAGWCTVCLMCLFQPFMKMWMGEELMFPDGVMFLFCYYFMMLKQGDINSMYYQAAGLWWHGKMRSIVEAILNLCLNLILGKLLGITGILLATIISYTCIYFYATKFVFTIYFKNDGLKKFYIENVFYMMITAAVSFGMRFLIKELTFGMGTRSIFILSCILCLFIPNACFMGIYGIDQRNRKYIGLLMKKAKKSLHLG